MVAQEKKSILATLFSYRESAIFLALIILMATVTIFAPNFMSGSNLYLVSRQISFVAVVAFGELFVILTGGIDLSVGSVMGLSGVVAAGAMAGGQSIILSVLLGLATGIALGLINGLLISYVRIAPFIATLGMLSFARGVILIVTKGWPITNIPKPFLIVGQGDFLSLPIPLWVMIVLAAVAHFLLSRTAFGRRTYAIGGNEQATFLSGINVKKIKVFLYMISGFMASVVGIILIARFNSAQADTGTGWELDAIAAAVIGGTSLSGGSGSIFGVIIGAAIMGVIRNGLVLMRVSPYWQTAVIGIIIVLAAVLDRIKNK
ncbi:MAG: ABC transporter permease [Spirochaetota bacterium]|jgi:ribose transport system permease protein|uniref:D-ribose transporter subunit membrane component of ABC superfamily n=1 Tax=uncultured spirochete TaxID=156406 RepID=A0A3P3XFW9_9SPIR|nr:D-ribose transporter subunit; membrane component of ABC superfamily [uncultured spirochete]